MKKDYNRDVMSDMPVEASFTPSTQAKTTKTTTKPKISAIGTQKRTTTSKSTSTSKSNASKTSTLKSSSSKSLAGKESTAKTDKEQQEVKSKKLRTKLTNSDSEISDLEKLNEENIKSYRFKSKRNKVLIAVLSVLLAITIVSIVTYLTISRLKTNCNFYAHGDASVVFVIDGTEMDEFRTPSNLQGNRILKLDIKVKIESSGYYNVKFIPKCYQKGVLMNNTLIYEQNFDLFYEGGDGYYYSINPISGDQTIRLCQGVILDYEYEHTLNVDNFRMDFDVYFEKV